MVLPGVFLNFGAISGARSNTPGRPGGCFAQIGPAHFSVELAVLFHCWKNEEAPAAT